MSYINPLAGALAQTNQVQRHQSVDRDRQSRRNDPTRKPTSANGETIEHEVENTDEVILQNQEEHPADQRKGKRRHPHDDPSNPDEESPPEALDIRA